MKLLFAFTIVFLVTEFVSPGSINSSEDTDLVAKFFECLCSGCTRKQCDPKWKPTANMIEMDRCLLTFMQHRYGVCMEYKVGDCADMNQVFRGMGKDMENSIKSCDLSYTKSTTTTTTTTTTKPPKQTKWPMVPKCNNSNGPSSGNPATCNIPNGPIVGNQIETTKDNKGDLVKKDDGLVKEILNVVDDVVTGTTNDLKDVGNTLDTVTKYVPLIGDLTNTLTTWTEHVDDPVKNTGNTVSEVVKDAVNTVKDTVGGVTKTLGGILG